MDKVNPTVLHNELIAAGIDTSGCDCNGVVWGLDGYTEIQERADVAAIIAAHDPAPTPVTVIEYDMPIKAPPITVSNVYIESPKPKDDPDEALAEAIAEAAKTGKKDMSLIVVSLLKYVNEKVKK